MLYSIYTIQNFHFRQNHNLQNVSAVTNLNSCVNPLFPATLASSWYKQSLQHPSKFLAVSPIERPASSASVSVPVPATGTKNDKDRNTTFHNYIAPILLAGKFFISGIFAGACETITGHPLDTIKSKMQTEGKSSNTKHFNGTYDCLKKTVTEDGFFALYNGVASQAARASISASVMFGVIGYFRDLFRIDYKKDYISFPIIAAAYCAAVVEAVVYTPFEVVKVRMQTLNYAKNYTSWKCAKDIFAEHKIIGLYRGIGPTIQRETIGNIVYFGSYEAIKGQFRRFRQTDELVFSDIAIAGGFAGTLYWVAVFPFDTMKSIMQSDHLGKPKYKNTYQCAKDILKTNSITRFYRGITPSLLRAFPTNAIIFVAFETCLDFLERTCS